MDSTAHLRIGEAAQASGVSVANIRYYEKEGLLGRATRGNNGYRFYSAEDLHRLRFVRLCRGLDMSLDEVRTMLALDLRRKADCVAASEALDGHLRHVRERLAELRALERDLLALRRSCDGESDQCHLIEALHARAETAAVTEAHPRAHRHV